MSSGFYIWESSFNCAILNIIEVNPINEDCSAFRIFTVCTDAVTYCSALKMCTNYIFN